MQIYSKEDQNIIFEIQRMENEIKYAKRVLDFPRKNLTYLRSFELTYKISMYMVVLRLLKVQFTKGEKNKFPSRFFLAGNGAVVYR